MEHAKIAGESHLGKHYHDQLSEDTPRHCRLPHFNLFANQWKDQLELNKNLLKFSLIFMYDCMGGKKTLKH